MSHVKEKKDGDKSLAREEGGPPPSPRHWAKLSLRGPADLKNISFDSTLSHLPPTSHLLIHIWGLSHPGPTVRPLRLPHVRCQDDVPSLRCAESFVQAPPFPLRTDCSSASLSCKDCHFPAPDSQLLPFDGPSPDLHPQHRRATVEQYWL